MVEQSGAFSTCVFVSIAVQYKSVSEGDELVLVLFCKYYFTQSPYFCLNTM